MRKTSWFSAVAGVALLALGGPDGAAAQTRTTLDIYVVDVEGGNATLFVSPSGESVLIDTGNFAPQAAIRDAERVAAAARDAHLTQIDHLITTHWHNDHFGGMAEVAKRIAIREYIDHGPNIEQVAQQYSQFFTTTYPALYGAARHTVVKPGDSVPVAGLDWRIVSAAGAVLKTPLSGAPGAGAVNAGCADFKPQATDPTENAQSVGSVVTFGTFRVAHLGDLTWNKEFDLMCPNNQIGTVDLVVVSHHGLGVSNSPALVHALHSRVAILNNGPRKGAVPATMKTLFTSPGLEDIWQIHFSQLGGQEYTVPGMFIANLIDQPLSAMPVEPIAAPGPDAPPPPAHSGPAYWIKVSARPDGVFTVTNGRNGFAKTYGQARGG